jgi:hypothetical protein
MSLPDSFYIALCMTILLVGAVYWVWTQIQFVQRKVNVLENIVYELKTLCSKHTEFDGPVAPTKYPPAPTSVIGEEDEDLLRETLQSEEEGGISSPTMKLEEVEYVEEAVAEPPHSPLKPFEDDVVDAGAGTGIDIAAMEMQVGGEEIEGVIDLPAFEVQEATISASSDLQPGGVGSGAIDYNSASALDAMSLKELRRLAQSKGISGASDMKKKDLVIAIRSTPMEAFLE